MSDITLTTRKGSYQVPAEQGTTIVELAKKHNITWGHACERGICAQCRTKVETGAEHLNETTPEEKLRLRKEERRNHFRLGCQIRIKSEGEITLVHSPY